MSSRAHTLLISILCVAVPAAAFAQGASGADGLARNTIALEVLGHGGAYSLNYERLINPEFGMRVGLAYYEVHGGTVLLDGVEEYRPDAGAYITLVPLTGSWLRGREHNLELGGGPLLGYARLDLADLGSAGAVLWGVAGLAGYRYQAPGGGFFFRAAYTPLWSGGELSPLWFGLGFGYTW